MASQKRTQSHEWIKDPLELDRDPREPASLPPEPAPADVVLTGLSEEEDARRHLALRLNPNLAFCTNCEIYCEVADIEHGPHDCPVCNYWLSLPGTKPIRHRFKV